MREPPPYQHARKASHAPHAATAGPDHSNRRHMPTAVVAGAPHRQWRYRRRHDAIAERRRALLAAPFTRYLEPASCVNHDDICRQPPAASAHGHSNMGAGANMADTREPRRDRRLAAGDGLAGNTRLAPQTLKTRMPSFSP